MSEKTQPAFDRVGDVFVDDYYSTIRGYVRQEATRANLKPFIDRPLLAVDIGGGDGRDSEWLASLGCQTTLVDLSPKMLEKAQNRGGIAEFRQGDASTILEEGKAGSFDLVISHGVLMYDLENPYGHLDNLVKLLKPGGKISLLTKGYHGSLLGLSERGDHEGHAYLKKTHQVVNNLGETAWAFDSKELTRMLKSSGATVLDWFGVRVASDDRREQISQYPQAYLDEILQTERLLGSDPKLREQGRMLHFIAQKTT